MASSGDFEVEKVLIWKTKLPYKDEVRQSPSFWLMDLEWCLRFSYKVATKGRNQYHRITLHQVIDGRVSLASNATSALNKRFSIRTSLKGVTDLGVTENHANTANATSSTTELWFAGKNKDDIYEILPCLYGRAMVKVVCRFYDQPLSALQLAIYRVQLSSEVIGTEDRSVRASLDTRGCDVGVQVTSEVPRDIESLSSDFSNLLEREILPDVNLECSGRTFRVHRSVLVARSQVYRAMFQNEMLESETRTVKIRDMDAGVLQKFLKFLYSGRPDELSEECVSDLYAAADKYDVPSLKTACAYWTSRNLTAENCIEFLKMAETHSDYDLKAAIVAFSVENPSVMKCEAWLELKKELPSLAMEVYETYFASIVP